MAIILEHLLKIKGKTKPGDSFLRQVSCILWHCCVTVTLLQFCQMADGEWFLSLMDKGARTLAGFPLLENAFFLLLERFVVWLFQPKKQLLKAVPVKEINSKTKTNNNNTHTKQLCFWLPKPKKAIIYLMLSILLETSMNTCTTFQALIPSCQQL